MNITINTDASFCPHTKVGGFAFYIVCNQFKIQKAGEFKTLPKNSTEAEVMCIGNAIATLMVQELPENINYIIINTDSLNGIHNITMGGGKIYGKVRKLKNKIKRVSKANRLEFRHVKAHSGAQDARSWVNEWCDTEAKKYMRRARQKIAQLN